MRNIVDLCGYVHFAIQSVSVSYMLTSRGEDSGHQGAHRHGRLPSIAGTDPFLFH